MERPACSICPIAEYPLSQRAFEYQEASGDDGYSCARQPAPNSPAAFGRTGGATIGLALMACVGQNTVRQLKIYPAMENALSAMASFKPENHCGLPASTPKPNCGCLSSCWRTFRRVHSSRPATFSGSSRLTPCPERSYGRSSGAG